MNYNIAIVEDTRLDSEKLERGISKWFHENMGSVTNLISYSDGESLLKSFEPDKYQIIFVDIIMDSLTGIETVKKLRSFDNKVLIIFTTSSHEFVLDAFPLHPFDYVLKPYDSNRLGQVLSEAVKFLDSPEPSVTVRVSRSKYRILMRDISAVLARDHTVEIVMTGGNSLLCSMKFREFETIFKDEMRFLECNRGIMINMDCVQTLSKDKSAFIMKDGSHYAIRVRKHKDVLTKFTQYQIYRNRSINE